MEEGKGDFKILTGKPTDKGPIRRSQSRWEDNIAMVVKEMCVNMRNLNWW